MVQHEPAPARTAEREVWADNLRVTVIAAVVLVHVAGSYAVDVGWYYTEPNDSELTRVALAVPVFTGLLFGLGPLLVVSGWFAASSLRRHGPGRYAVGRLLRLGLPLAAYVLLIDPVTAYLADRAEGGHRTLTAYLTDATGTRAVGPLWFVAALLPFALVYAGWRTVLPRAGTSTAPTWQPLAVVVGLVAVADFATWLVSPYTSPGVWQLDWAHWPQSAGLFVVGVVAGERGWFDRPELAAWGRRCGWLAVAGAAGLAALALASVGAPDLPRLAGGWHWQTAGFAVLDGVVAVGFSVWAVAWFRVRWDAREHELGDKAARGSYATYLLHPVVLVVLAAVVAHAPLSPDVKLVLVALVGLPACFVVGYGATRLPVLGRLL